MICSLKLVHFIVVPDKQTWGTRYKYNEMVIWENTLFQLEMVTTNAYSYCWSMLQFNYIVEVIVRTSEHWITPVKNPITSFCWLTSYECLHLACESNGYWFESSSGYLLQAEFLNKLFIHIYSATHTVQYQSFYDNFIYLKFISLFKNILHFMFKYVSCALHTCKHSRFMDIVHTCILKGFIYILWLIIFISNWI